MKLHIKTNKEWIITESSLVSYVKKEQTEIINVTESEHQKIIDQYDTRVSDWKIVSQKKWENTIRLEEERDKEKQEKFALKQKEPKPTE